MATVLSNGKFVKLKVLQDNEISAEKIYDYLLNGETQAKYVRVENKTARVTKAVRKFLVKKPFGEK